MIDGYRSFGHHFAKTDPLNFHGNKNLNSKIDEESIKAHSFGFLPAEMKSVMSTDILTHSEIKKGSMTIEQLEAYLKHLYCGKVGL